MYPADQVNVNKGERKILEVTILYILELRDGKECGEIAIS